jgi:hypothetical protein
MSFFKRFFSREKEREKYFFFDKKLNIYNCLFVIRASSNNPLFILGVGPDVLKKL